MERGDIEWAFEEFGWHVYQRALVILKNEQDARDTCHDVFIKLMESPATVSDRKKLQPWIYRVTTNACIDRIRLRKRHEPESVERLLVDGDIEESAARTELILLMLGHLSKAEQQLAILRYIDECTLGEMEEICGLTRKTISKRLMKVQSKAQKIMKAQNGYMRRGK